MQNAHLGAFCNTFDLHKVIIGLETQFSAFLRVAVLHRFYCISRLFWLQQLLLCQVVLLSKLRHSVDTCTFSHSVPSEYWVLAESRKLLKLVFSGVGGEGAALSNRLKKPSLLFVKFCRLSISEGSFFPDFFAQ